MSAYTIVQCPSRPKILQERDPHHNGGQLDCPSPQCLQPRGIMDDQIIHLQIVMLPGKSLKNLLCKWHRLIC